MSCLPSANVIADTHVLLVVPTRLVTRTRKSYDVAGVRLEKLDTSLLTGTMSESVLPLTRPSI